MSLYKDRTAPTALLFDARKNKTPEYAVLSGDGLVVVHRCFVRKECTLLHYNYLTLSRDRSRTLPITDLGTGKLAFKVSESCEIYCNGEPSTHAPGPRTPRRSLTGEPP